MKEWTKKQQQCFSRCDKKKGRKNNYKMVRRVTVQITAKSRKKLAERASKQELEVNKHACNVM